MEVWPFESGFELLTALESRLPDCILLDIRMPGIGGFEVQRRLHERGIHLPTVIITAQDDPQVRERATAVGADFLSKPFSAQLLRDRITEVCGARASTTKVR
jgi:FixJ family two-component response regulator